MPTPRFRLPIWRLWTFVWSTKILRRLAKNWATLRRFSPQCHIEAYIFEFSQFVRGFCHSNFENRNGFAAMNNHLINHEVKCQICTCCVVWSWRSIITCWVCLQCLGAPKFWQHCKQHFTPHVSGHINAIHYVCSYKCLFSRKQWNLNGRLNVAIWKSLQLISYRHSLSPHTAYPYIQ